MKPYSRESSKQIIDQKLTDWDAESPEELMLPLENLSPMSRQVSRLTTTGEEEITNPNHIESFRGEPDPLKRLKLLTTMSIPDAVEEVYNAPNDNVEQVRSYLSARIDFYDRLSKGTALLNPNEEFWDFEKKTMRYPKLGEAIDNFSVTPESIQTGLLRDLLYAHMIGTPELGIYKMARKQLRRMDVPDTHMPHLFGFSKISKENEGFIGTGYPFLSQLYDRAIKTVKKRQESKETSLSDDELEHEAVLTASRWLSEAMKYNSHKRTPDSSYTASLEEAVAWARLGGQVKSQLRGMRQKIDRINLKGIGRFIGRSGDSPYYSDIRRLKKEIESGNSARSVRIELAEAEKKHAQKASLAQKAIDLQFRQASFEGKYINYPTIDWINEAPFGLINWTYKALSRGVSEKTAFGYARAATMFPDAEIDWELIEMSGNLSRSNYRSMRDIEEVNTELQIDVPPKQLVALASFSLSIYRALVEKGYPLEVLVGHPWLNDAYIKTLPEGKEFPFSNNKREIWAWCLDHNYIIPKGWNRKRLGKLILQRLDLGIDNNIHQATHWLRIFDLPEEVNGDKYIDHSKEIDLLQTMILTEDSSIRQRLPGKSRKVSELFSEDATRIMYEALLTPVRNGEIDIEDISEIIEEKLGEYRSDPKKNRSLEDDLPETEMKIQGYISELKLRTHTTIIASSPLEIVGELRTIGKKRKEYIEDSQRWVETHGATPHTLLQTAWGNRKMALADGCEDNPRAIVQWAELNGLRVAINQMSRRGSLPDNINKDSLERYRDWLKELIRCYDARSSIKALSSLIERYNPEYKIPPMVIDLGDGYVGEIFAKNDPRGFTIGHGTGCCMTLGGEAQTCIEAGYEKPPYGFFALSRNGKLVAQSFLYSNKEKYPEAIVCDNIEANKGRDSTKVLERYQVFFQQYFERQLLRDNNFSFRRVHVGEGYTSTGLDSLREVDSIPMPDSGIYTDATKQRLLLEISDPQVEILNRYNASIVNPRDWPILRDSILTIENEAFKGNGYSEEVLQEEFSNPDNIVVVMKDGEQIIGYSTCMPKNHNTLYVSSTALHPNYQGKRLVAEMMHTLDIEALGRGFEFYERDASLENGYVNKLKKNYDVVNEGQPHNSPYGLQQFLRMRIPDEAHSLRLENSDYEHPESEISFSPVSSKHSPIIAELERAIYPPRLIQGVEDWEAELMYDATRFRYGNASFLISEEGTGKPVPIGYVIAYVDESEALEGDSKVLYVRDIALLESKQRKGYGKQAMLKLLQFSSNRNGMPIEFYAREKNSYRAIKQSLEPLKQMGYRLVSEEIDENHVDSGENFYLLRLEKIDV